MFRRVSSRFSCQICRFRIEKSGIKMKKGRCGSARNFHNKCYHGTNLFQYLKVQLIEQVHSSNLENIEDVVWDTQKHWPPQLFPIVKEMNSILNLYSSKKNGCQKR